MKFNVHSGNNAAISEKSTSDERTVKLFGIINAVDRSCFTRLLFEKSFRRNNDVSLVPLVNDSMRASVVIYVAAAAAALKSIQLSVWFIERYTYV